MQRPRTPSRISESLHHQLNSYALAASAAGVSVLALALPAEGKIIYTKVHHVIRLGKSYDLDLNNDGTSDFLINNVNISTTGQQDDRLYLVPATGNGFLLGLRTMGSNCKTCPALVVSGYSISHRGSFSGKPVILARASTGVEGNNTFWGGRWADVSNGYLGLKFQIGNETHYGWARLSVRESFHFRHRTSPVTATITGYAYETIPNKPIIAGKTHGKDVVTVQPGSLGHLAAGASGLHTWRQK